MKYSIITITLLALAAAPLWAQEAEGNKKEKKNPDAGEFVSLFDGETLAGWKPSTLGNASYTVVDGAIRGETVEGSPNTFLLSEKEYGDFVLEFEVKVHDELNSGCQIRSREKSEADLAATGKDGKPATDLNRFHGPQVELESSPGQAGFIYGEATGRGWISHEPQVPGLAHTAMKNGEWNKIRIVARGPRIQTYINDALITTLVDKEIYESHPKGRIGLQVHGIKKGTGPFDVMWKNIRIKEFQ